MSPSQGPEVSLYYVRYLKSFQDHCQRQWGKDCPCLPLLPKDSNLPIAPIALNQSQRMGPTTLPCPKSSLARNWPVTSDCGKLG